MSREHTVIDSNWFKATFDALYPIVYKHRSVEAAQPESEFSIAELGITSSDRVLDLCCGAGRHMAHLVNASEHVTGLDFSTDLLSRARTLLDSKAQLVRGDMRNLPFREQFDAVTNYFTSFGYFRNAEENLSVVRSIARALKPGGRFFIDHMNKSWTVENLKGETERESEGFTVVERRWIDDENQRVNKTTIVSSDGNEINRTGESVQLYTLEEFDALLEDGGLKVERWYGDYDGGAMDASRPRMIAVGRKA